MEFHADLVLPYRDELQSIPMHGQFVLVQLEHEDEAVLGRITSVSAEGRLVSPIGEDYAIRAMRDDRPIPDELRDQYLKYRVDIRVLGVERLAGDKLIFVPSHRRLPHVGAKVALCSPEVLREVANAVDAGTIDTAAAEIGFLAFGEFVYAGDDPRGQPEDWMVVLHPPILPRFQAAQLVSRRTLRLRSRGLRQVQPDQAALLAPVRGQPCAPLAKRLHSRRHHHFRPGRRVLLARFRRPSRPVRRPSLTERTVVFTSQQPPSPAYGSFVVDSVKLDIRQLSAQRVIGIALPADRQDQQNVTKLKSLGPDRWRPLVDLIAAHRYDIDPAEVRRLCGIKTANEELQTNAIISNMTRVVEALHDPSSQLLRALMTALRAGKLCVVDISQLRGQRGLQLASIILAEIFSHNQREFTKAIPHIVPCIAVIEEAQAVLGAGGSGSGSGSAPAEDSPFVSWVKEGRKYGLGAVLVTQQPGSIPAELLSQGDNFFVFHLLSAGDLAALKRANAHFSDDLLATLLNEPLVGPRDLLVQRRRHRPRRATLPAADPRAELRGREPHPARPRLQRRRGRLLRLPAAGDVPLRAGRRGREHRVCGQEHGPGRPSRRPVRSGPGPGRTGGGRGRRRSRPDGRGGRLPCGGDRSPAQAARVHPLPVQRRGPSLGPGPGMARSGRAAGRSGRQPLRLGPPGRPPGAGRDPGPAGLWLAHRVPPPPRSRRILPDLDPPHGNGRVFQQGNPARGLLRLTGRCGARKIPASYDVSFRLCVCLTRVDRDHEGEAMRIALAPERSR